MHSRTLSIPKVGATGTNGREHLVALAGGLAMTQWKINVVLDAMQRVDPDLVVLIRGVVEASTKLLSGSFAEFAEQTAREHGIELDRPN